MKDIRIVGLGEATHVIREFFQVKHRLVEFLVVRMALTAFALEAAYSDAQPINDYILDAEADRDSVLTGQGYVAWDTEEFATMLDWLRAYNRTVSDERKVRFYGADLFRNEVGRKRIFDCLRRVAPYQAEAIDPVFRILAAEEAKWPLWLRLGSRRRGRIWKARPRIWRRGNARSPMALPRPNLTNSPNTSG